MSTRGASRKGQERSEAILDAAEQLLVDEGHAALSAPCPRPRSALVNTPFFARRGEGA